MTHRLARRSLTLIEIVVALSLLVLLVLGLGAAMSGSLGASRATKPALHAYEAANRLVESMRTQDFSTLFSTFDGGTKVTVSGDDWIVDDTASVMAAVRQPLLDAMDQGEMQPSSAGLALTPADPNGHPLRVRFLDYSDYQAIWGATAHPDPRPVGSRSNVPVSEWLFLPVLVEVHWRDRTGDHVHQLTALIGREG